MHKVTHPQADGYTGAQLLPAKNETDAARHEDPKRYHLLAAMRCASVRLYLAKLDVDSIGTALKGGLISTDEAFGWLAEIGALPLIDTVLGGNDASEEAAQ